MNDVGHRELRLPHLDLVAASAMLQAWGVQGNQDTLDILAAPFCGDPMSLNILGAFLGHFCGGDPGAAGRLPGLPPAGRLGSGGRGDG